MEIVEIEHTAIPSLPETVCCVGYFDGLHKGHQLLLNKTLDLAKQEHLASGVILFDPDPWTIFHPEQTLDYLTPLPKRLSMLAKKGFDFVYILRFTKSFAALHEQAFHDVLVAMHVQTLVCGTDFHYAAKNKGNVDSLKSDPRLRVVALDPFMETQQQKISSSTIERYVKEGKIELADELLGYMYSLDGIIGKGFQRGGKLLGIPTANLECDPDYVLPATGVYAGFVQVGRRLVPAMINIGYNPTFGNEKKTIEAHLLDFNDNLYGRRVRFLFAVRLRPEQKFASIEALKAQLHRDIVSTRDIRAKKSVKDWCFD